MITNKGTQVIKTPRLLLRRFQVSDAGHVFENWANDEVVTKFLTWKPHGSIAVTQEILALWEEKYKDENVYNWAIVLDYLEQPIGSIAVVHLDESNSACEIGYCLSKHFWNQGIMTEVLSAVIKFMFDEVNINRVQAKHDTDNTGSGRVMSKSGMRLEGVLRRAGYRQETGFFDYALYSIIRDDLDIAKEIEYYNSLPLEFEDFIELPKLSDGELELVCVEKKPAIPEKKYVPAYDFDILLDNEAVGTINLRIGYTDGLYYGGQIGYGIKEEYRGNSFAAKACKLLEPVIKAHGMKKVLITNNKSNAASRRVCEKLGARLVRLAELPAWHELYLEGQRYVNIFEWTVE